MVSADHLGIGKLGAAIGSDGRTNMEGPLKLGAIRQHLGGGEFGYIGDSMADLVVLRAARRAFLVRPSCAPVEAARASCRVGQIFE